ncbi:RWP-RK domain [Plasmopara halstedii]|uniref:RWP-RK domain n=1 Tax=Plasmopara halstedii TaxID=4781 RepID=A0A0P1AAG8_PLAHL|nr:RWP-RK domain [Plasmopara halstedii]CEG37866.1 RWP-RK domain [Plasmopara halstedii]|eukprot:XP_024574235.1 RWP-RK domain [Plasmopara halstedii]
MATMASPFLSVDDLLMGEILMSLKRDSPAPHFKLESESQLPSYRSKLNGLSVEVAPPPSTFPSDADSPVDVFSLDAFRSVSPMAYKLPLHPATPLNVTASPTLPSMSVTPRGSNKRYGPVVQLEDLRECFNMPIAAVARKFGICATLLKKICRRHGIQRWPHRQIRSLQKSIDMLRESLRVAKGTNKEYILKKIATFECTLDCIMQDPNTAAKGITTGRLASPATEEFAKRGSRVKNSTKAVAMPTLQTSLSDNEESAKNAPLTQDWTPSIVPGPSAQRLNSRRASVPMSLQSILC